MKTKTKIKKENKKTIARKPTEKSYPAHYLAITLAVVLIVEGVIMGGAHQVDWHSAVSILDVSSSVSQIGTDISDMAQPFVTFAQGVNQFYQLSATQMTILLDASDYASNLTVAFSGVSEFYHQAATQMAILLDASGTGLWPGTVSGVSISR